eukprot:TRINITY_DN2774_c0_g1_i3.p1 TRINITY_DN2774_c0_g1~~TRINITY_DN2774_c0_g1_i3.p1  ORF type:complete len:1390 (+),score=569.74 TRINITY_DN2774_c0_g1_i3:37-4206(+)
MSAASKVVIPPNLEAQIDPFLKAMPIENRNVPRIAQLVSLLNSGNSKIRENAATLLAALCFEAPNRDHLRDEGYIGPILSILKDADPAVSRHGTFAAMSLANLDKNKDYIRDNNLLSLYFDALGKPPSPAPPQFIQNLMHGVLLLATNQQNREIIGSNTAYIKSLSSVLLNMSEWDPAIGDKVVNTLVSVSVSKVGRETAMREGGAIAALVAALHKRQDDHDLATKILPALFNLSIIEPNREAIRAAGGLTELSRRVSLPQPQHDNLITLCLRTFTNLSVDKATCAYVATNNLFGEFIKILWSKNDAMINHALSAIQNLLDDDECLESFNRSHAIPPLVHVVSVYSTMPIPQQQAGTPASPIPAILAKAVLLLSELFGLQDAQHEFLELDNNPIGVLLSAYSCPVLDVHKNCTRALANLSQFHDNIRGRLGVSGVIPPIIQQLQQKDREAVRQALRALTNLSLNANNAIIIFKANILDTIIAMCNISDQELRVLATKILVNMTMHEPLRAPLSDKGGMQIALQLMASADDPEVQLQGAKLVTNFALYGKNRKAMTERGFGKVLQEYEQSAVKRASSSPAAALLQTQIETALGNLSFPYEEKYEDKPIELAAAQPSLDQLELEEAMQRELDRRAEEEAAAEEEERLRALMEVEKEKERRRVEEEKAQVEEAKRKLEERRREDERRKLAEAALRKKREEEEAKRKADEEAQRKALEERKKKEEAEARRRVELERKRVEEERKRKEEEARKAREEKERREREEAARREAERREKEERERKALEERERLQREEEDRKMQEIKEEQKKREQEEKLRKMREDAARRAREAEAQRAKEEADRKAREENERRERERREAEQRAKEEKERRDREEKEREVQRAREEAERKAAEERERKEREEAARLEKERLARIAREERERADREEAARKAREEEEVALRRKEEELALRQQEITRKEAMLKKMKEDEDAARQAAAAEIAAAAAAISAAASGHSGSSVPSPGRARATATSFVNTYQRDKEPITTGADVKARSMTWKAATSPATSPRETEQEKAAKLAKRARISQELISVERGYVRNLSIIIKLFLNPLQSAVNSRKPILPADRIKKIFGIVEVIYNYNSLLLEGLDSRIRRWQENQAAPLLVGDIFIKMCDYMQCYSTYINNYDDATNLLRESKRSNEKFAQFIAKAETDPECRMQELESFLIHPVQQLPRYILLLSDMLRSTPQDHPDLVPLTQAVERMRKLTEFVNEQKRQAEDTAKMAAIQRRIVGKNNNVLAAGRKFIKEGPCQYNSTTMKEKDREQFKDIMYVFLFNDMLVFTTSRTKGSVIGSKTSTEYKWREHLPLSNKTFINAASGGDRAFMVQDTQLGKLYTLTFPSPADRQQWLQKLTMALAALSAKGV